MRSKTPRESSSSQLQLAYYVQKEERAAEHRSWTVPRPIESGERPTADDGDEESLRCGMLWESERFPETLSRVFEVHLTS